MSVKPEAYCVTGASGFIASHLISKLLSAGHHVHGTVRHLKDTKHAFLHTLPNAQTHLKLFECDLLQANSFTPAMAGTAGVFHCAGPWLSTAASYDDHWRPHVEGTRLVVETAIATPTVRRVVLVSSVAAVYCVCEGYLNKERRSYSESDWNEEGRGHSLGCVANRSAENAYFQSKAAAEREAWQKIKEANEKDSTRHISLVSINPSVTIGNLLSHPSLESLNTSMQFILGLMYGGDEGGTGVTDVDDVAEALLRAMTNPGASGRYICSGGSYSYPTLSATLARLYPDRCFAEAVTDDKSLVPVFNTEKIKTELNIQFTPIEETLKKAVDSLIENGCVM